MTRATRKNARVTAVDARTLLVNSRVAANLTQGFYARTTPTPAGEAAGFLTLCKDPNQNGVNGTGRIWGYGLTSGTIGYSDDYGATFVSVQALPAGAAGTNPCQIEITSGVGGGDFMFVLFNSNSPNQGSLWRAPAPGATPTSLTFTCIQANDATNNIVNGPAATAGHTGDGSNYRNQCFAIQPDGSKAYLVNYAAGTANATPTTRTDGIMGIGSDILSLPTSNGFYGSMGRMAITVSGAGAGGATLSATIKEIYGTGKVQLDKVAQTAVTGATVTFSAITQSLDIFQGPGIRVCANPCAAAPSSVLWTVTKQWGFARHAHAVRVIGGVPWVSLGDFPYPANDYGYTPLTHVGLWAASDAAGTTWTQRLVSSAYMPLDGLNFLPVTIGGQPMIVMESDSRSAIGPVLVPTQTPTGTVVNAIVGLGVQIPVVATMRCLTLTTDGNLMWYGTGESGAVGPVDGIFAAAPPFDNPVLLEQLASGTLASALNGIEVGPYVFMGKIRVTKEKFAGQ